MLIDHDIKLTLCLQKIYLTLCNKLQITKKILRLKLRQTGRLFRHPLKWIILVATAGIPLGYRLPAGAKHLAFLPLHLSAISAGGRYIIVE